MSWPPLRDHHWVVTDTDGRQLQIPGGKSQPPAAAVAIEVRKQADRVHAIRVRQQQAEHRQRLDALTGQVEDLAARLAAIPTPAPEATSVTPDDTTGLVEHTDQPGVPVVVAKWQIAQWRKAGWAT